MTEILSFELLLNLVTAAIMVLVLVKGFVGGTFTDFLVSRVLLREQRCQIRKDDNCGSDATAEVLIEQKKSCLNARQVVPADKPPVAASSLAAGSGGLEVAQATRQKPSPFRVLGALSESQKRERQIKSILNKLTREKFEGLYCQLLDICFRESMSLEVINVVARELCTTATVQHTLAELYAELCARLYADLKQKVGADMAFKMSLLQQCQRSFKLYLQPLLVDDKLEAEEQYEQLVKFKTKMLGNVRLIAHLICQDMLSVELCFQYSAELLKIQSPETLETLCALLSTLKGFFNTPEWQANLKLQHVISRMQSLSQDPQLSQRIRFLIKDTLAALSEMNTRQRSSGDDHLAREQPVAPEIGSDRKPRAVLLGRTSVVAGAPEKQSTWMLSEKPTQTRQVQQPVAVDAAERSLEERFSSSSSSAPASRQSERHSIRRRESDGKSICRLLVGIQEERSFQVCRKLIGPGGENVKRIVAKAPDAKIRIRGLGSKYLEGSSQEESLDPLQICVSATSRADFDCAMLHVEKLLSKVHEEYRSFCASKGRSVPELTVCPEIQRRDARS